MPAPSPWTDHLSYDHVHLFLLKKHCHMDLKQDLGCPHLAEDKGQVPTTLEGTVEINL